MRGFHRRVGKSGRTGANEPAYSERTPVGSDGLCCAPGKLLRSARRLSVVNLLGVAASFLPGIAYAEEKSPTVIHVGDGTVDTKRLNPGSHRYLRYTVKDGRRIAQDIWNRTVSFEMKDGRRLLHITQRWDEANAPPGTGSALEQDSWFEPSTFRPITHVRTVTKADGKTVAGYEFKADGAVGMKDLAGNTRRDFAIAYAEWPFNFEYDMELLQTLPLRAGFDANIPFYDAGIDKKSDRYDFKVAGSNSFTGWDGRMVDCWLVTADYNSGVIKSRFWFDKRTYLLVREEASLPDGGLLVKTLLPPEAADKS